MSIRLTRVLSPRLNDDADKFPPAMPAHPWLAGQIFYSPGGHWCYRVVGPCCRLFDREQLPWPCCRLQWRGKEPSWRRIGKRLTPDMATKKHPSYSVQILGQGAKDPFVITLYTVKLSAAEQEWWHAKKSSTARSSTSGDAEETRIDG